MSRKLTTNPTKKTKEQFLFKSEHLLLAQVCIIHSWRREMDAKIPYEFISVIKMQDLKVHIRLLLLIYLLIFGKMNSESKCNTEKYPKCGKCHK